MSDLNNSTSVDFSSGAIFYEVVIIIIIMLSLTGVTLYKFSQLHACEKKPSSGCPRITCASKGPCEHNPYIFNGQGDIVCMDNNQEFVS